MYKVKFYTGDYDDRQKAVNADKAICYVEHHFNSSSDIKVNSTVVVVGSNSSDISREWGKYYAGKVSKAFKTKLSGTDGIVIGGYNRRGDGNIKYTNMPAILLEPLFVSNKEAATIVKSENGQLKLAEILADSIRKFFPKGGLVGFSVGHKYKDNMPLDRGASIFGGGVEADYAEKVLLKAKLILEKE